MTDDRTDPERTLPIPPENRPGTWWQRHEALVQTIAAIVVVVGLTLVWWRVSGSKTAVEDTLLTAADGRRADVAALPADLRDELVWTLREGRVRFAAPPPDRDDPRRAELGRVRQRFADFPLVTAVAFARVGLVDEAIDRLAELAREHPQSMAAQRLYRGAAATREKTRGLER